MNFISKVIMMKGLGILLFLCIATSSFAQNPSKSITSWNEKELENTVLVDVRTAEEFSEGHLVGALNYDWFNESFAEAFKDIPKDKTIYLYCKKGGRSLQAQELLTSLGYSEVINLSGGYDAWIARDN